MVDIGCDLAYNRDIATSEPNMELKQQLHDMDPELYSELRSAFYDFCAASDTLADLTNNRRVTLDVRNEIEKVLKRQANQLGKFL